MSVRKYWILDCDGVILNSNSLKTQAMYNAALQFGRENAEKLIAYHQLHGGVGRELKFNHFFSTILNRTAYEDDYLLLLKCYAENIEKALESCEVAPGLAPLVDYLNTQNTELVVVSGAEQKELRHLLKLHNIDHHFLEVLGSPKSKTDHITALIEKHGLPPAAFVGDSRYDYETANRFGIPFYFMHGWTDFAEWRTFFSTIKDVTVLEDLTCLYDYLNTAPPPVAGHNKV